MLVSNQRPQPQFWLNFGYNTSVDVIKDGCTVKETFFVALPNGIPLDNMPKITTGTQHQVISQWDNLLTARNGLLESIMNAVATLEPGESKILCGSGDIGALSMQVRRIGGNKTPTVFAETDKEINPFLQSINL